jgi:hypothetical protein
MSNLTISGLLGASILTCKLNYSSTEFIGCYIFIIVHEALYSYIIIYIMIDLCIYVVSNLVTQIYLR